jgi:hypothetical protein
VSGSDDWATLRVLLEQQLERAYGKRMDALEADKARWQAEGASHGRGRHLAEFRAMSERTRYAKEGLAEVAMTVGRYLAEGLMPPDDTTRDRVCQLFVAFGERIKAPVQAAGIAADLRTTFAEAGLRARARDMAMKDDAAFERVVRVMIASPGDVAEERQAATEEILEWNARHDGEGIVLSALKWETHSTPEMGDRPQAILNRQLVARADILVAIFWNRLGTPTGASKSGTVEEIEEGIAAGKPVMLYFSSAPTQMSSVDFDQYTRVQSFKESARKRGLYNEYSSVPEFRRSFCTAPYSNDHAPIRIRHQVSCQAAASGPTSDLVACNGSAEESCEC